MATKKRFNESNDLSWHQGVQSGKAAKLIREDKNQTFPCAWIPAKETEENYFCYQDY